MMSLKGKTQKIKLSKVDDHWFGVPKELCKNGLDINLWENGDGTISIDIYAVDDTGKPIYGDFKSIFKIEY